MTVHQFPDSKARQPLGTFNAVSVRDGASLERDDQPFFEMNALDTADGRPLCEVQFGDGAWLLADPTQDLVPAFELDALPDRTFLAVSYGDDWNGRATPIVTRAVLEQMLLDLDEPNIWDGDTVRLGDGERLMPFFSGLYDLGTLGWMISKVNPARPA